MSINHILILGLVAFAIFGVFLMRWLLNRNTFNLTLFCGALGIAALCFGWVGIRIAAAIYKKGTHAVASMHKRLAPRSGREIYVALFGEPVGNCLTIINQQDQIVPRLDCCIWLEFTACPGELTRISRLAAYQQVKYDSIPYGPLPAWWTPNKLGSKAIMLKNYSSDNPNRDQVLIFASDGTHAYYCDMAD